MDPAPGKFIRSTALRRSLARMSGLFNRVTCRISRGDPQETIEELARRRPLNDRQRLFLEDLGASKAGARFIDEKVRTLGTAVGHAALTDNLGQQRREFIPL